MTEQDKEEIINVIIQQKLFSASEIASALPKYTEEELRELLLDDDFYNALAMRMQEIKKRAR